jgi:hypothetical protein
MYLSRCTHVYHQRRTSYQKRQSAGRDEIETNYIDGIDQLVGVFCVSLLDADAQVSRRDVALSIR